MCSQELSALHAKGQRRDWSELPPAIVKEIEEFLADQIVSATTLVGGFSPGIAARITTSSGQHRFVKAVSAEVNTDAARFHRREISIASRLRTIPDIAAPMLLWSFDSPDSPWVVLLFDHIEGRQPAQPWVPAELVLVIEAMNNLSRQLTPSPLSPDDVRKVHLGGLSGTGYWRHQIEHPATGLDPWSTRHLEKLADLEVNVDAALEGNTLLHDDLRADNMLITQDGVVFVDWPHASIGPAWFDPMAMAPSVEMHGGPKAADFFARFESATTADQESVTIALAALAGFFIIQSLQPEVPTIPGLRAFQAAQGEVARRWLSTRVDWD